MSLPGWPAGAYDAGWLRRMRTAYRVSDVGKEAESEALRRAGASPMLMRGRVMGGYLRMESDALDPRTVASWIQLARRYVEALPTKPKRKPAPKRK